MWAPVDELSDEDQRATAKSPLEVLEDARAAAVKTTDVEGKTRNKTSSSVKPKPSAKSSASAKSPAKKAAVKKAAAKKGAAKAKVSKTVDEEPTKSPENSEDIAGSDDEPVLKRPSSNATKGTKKRPAAASGGGTKDSPAKRKSLMSKKVYKYKYHKHNKDGFKREKKELTTVGV